MVMTAEAAALFAEARAVHASALERLAAGDVRDAAEKAWCATKRATDGLIVARTGEEPERSPATTRALEFLAAADPEVGRLLPGRYYFRQSWLHGQCFYMGQCDPLSTTERRIRETAAYIADAERLAGRDA